MPALFFCNELEFLTLHWFHALGVFPKTIRHVLFFKKSEGWNWKVAAETEGWKVQANYRLVRYLTFEYRKKNIRSFVYDSFDFI